MKFIILYTTLFCSLFAYLPFKKKYSISSSYLENRSNRYHAGFDFETGHKLGVPIYAPMDGYVIRIKVAPYGYGKALYFQDEQNITHVYAHLDGFAKKVEEHIYPIMLRKEISQLNTYPKGEEMFFRKGEIIAYSGESGIGTPHLHYETRKADGLTVNPVTTGLEIVDNMRPTLNYIAMWNEAEAGNFQITKVSEDIFNLSTKRPFDHMAFHIVDYSVEKENPMAIYSMELSCDDRVIFKKAMDSMPYGKMSQIQNELYFNTFESFGSDVFPRGDWHSINMEKGTRNTTTLKNLRTCFKNKNNVTFLLSLEDFNKNKSHYKFTVNTGQSVSNVENWQYKKYGQQDLLFSVFNTSFINVKKLDPLKRKGKLSFANPLGRKGLPLSYLMSQNESLKSMHFGNTDAYFQKEGGRQVLFDTKHFQVKINVKTPPKDRTYAIISTVKNGLTYLDAFPKGIEIKNIEYCFKNPGIGDWDKTGLFYMNPKSGNWNSYSKSQRSKEMVCAKSTEMKDIKVDLDKTAPQMLTYQRVQCKDYALNCKTSIQIQLKEEGSGFGSGNQIKTYVNESFVPNYYDWEQNHVTVNYQDTIRTIRIEAMDDFKNKMTETIRF